MEPLLKWAGGKRWLVPTLQKYVDPNTTRLIEPFCGGAAIFFGTQPSKAVLSDTNSDLIQTYCVVRDHPLALIDELTTYQNTPEFYYDIRRRQPVSDIERAARVYYLCRHSFNGIYRVNLRGEFNVPYNHKIWRSVFDNHAIMAASDSLRDVTLATSDFEAAITTAQSGDVVYCDPPYTVAHNNNGFLKYNESIFSFQDQVRLASVARQAALKGATVLISNASHDSIHELYKGCNIESLYRHSVVSANSKYRKPVAELLIKVTGAFC